MDTTEEVEARLHAIGSKRRRVQKQLDEMKPEIEEIIVLAAERGIPQKTIAEETGYTRDSIWRLTMTPEDREANNAKRRNRGKS